MLKAGDDDEAKEFFNKKDQPGNTILISAVYKDDGAQHKNKCSKKEGAWRILKQCLEAKNSSGDYLIPSNDDEDGLYKKDTVVYIYFYIIPSHYPSMILMQQYS